MRDLFESQIAIIEELQCWCCCVGHIVTPGLEITAGQRTMSGLIVDLTGQTFVLPVMLTGQNSVILKMK